MKILINQVRTLKYGSTRNYWQKQREEGDTFVNTDVYKKKLS